MMITTQLAVTHVTVGKREMTKWILAGFAAFALYQLLVVLPSTIFTPFNVLIGAGLFSLGALIGVFIDDIFDMFRLHERLG